MRIQRTLCAACLCVVVAGCAGEVTLPDAAPGDSVGGNTLDIGPREAGAKQDTGGAPGKDTGSPPKKDKGSNPNNDSGKPPPLADCSGIAKHPNWQVCGATKTTCLAKFTDSAGCLKVCKAAGMGCLEVWEDVTGKCQADKSKPKLTCVPGSGHQSDYWGCGAKPRGCVPRTCASALLHCGGNHPDGCGGTFSCSGKCPVGMACVKGYCGAPPANCKAGGKCPAFPGAEGEGMYALGGRGGDVCRVTNLNDSGAGSLRHCADTQKGPRTVVFNVAGIITLNKPLSFKQSRLTLAGQTAPGDGIMIRGYQVQIAANDVIVRHLRFRPGDLKIKKCSGNSGGGSYTEDALTVSGNRVIVDHVSASWGVDENLSASGSFEDVTVQYSFMTEGLAQTGLWHGQCESKYKPGGSKMHSMGGLYKPSSGSMNISLHHNLYAHNGNRNPAVGSYSSSQKVRADIRNNVIYNCPEMGYTSGKSSESRINYVGNFGVLGPSSKSQVLFKPNKDNKVKLYAMGNLMDKTKNGTLSGKDYGSSMVQGTFSKSSNPYTFKATTTHSASVALQQVLAWGGARPWSRDAADNKVVSDVKNNKGKLLNKQSSYGSLNAGSAVKDSDADGMPDAWEQTHGTNPTKADNNGDLDNDGYTNLEEYLHWAARPSR